MYVLGRAGYDLIKITKSTTLYDGQIVWSEVRTLEYEVPLNQATIISDYETAKKLLKEIQNNVEKIKFENNNIIGEILDKKNSFDKFSYAKELKLYELIPTEIEL